MAKETGSQSLLSQWTLTCLTVSSESAQSPGPAGFLQKDQGPLLHHLRSWWPAQGFMNCWLWALMRKKVGILCVGSTLRNLCELHVQTESSLSQDARSFLQFQESFWEEDPFFRIFLSWVIVIVILRKHKRSLVFVALGTPKLPKREEIGSSQGAWLLFTFLLYFCFFPLLPHPLPSQLPFLRSSHQGPGRVHTVVAGMQPVINSWFCHLPLVKEIIWGGWGRGDYHIYKIIKYTY